MKKENSDNILEDLRTAIKTYDRDLALGTSIKIIESGIDPLIAMNIMTDAIRDIGEGFEEGEYFLPDLVGAADAMTAALPQLERRIKESGQKVDNSGNIVIGTVFGDIHDIGKTMVSTLLKAAGFNVYDLGINIKPDEFIKAVKEHDADILAMSALLTTTAPEMQKVMQGMEIEGLRKKIKIIVGGGAITQDFADKIGADGYESTAPKAVDLAKKLLGK